MSNQPYSYEFPTDVRLLSDDDLVSAEIHLARLPHLSPNQETRLTYLRRERSTRRLRALTTPPVPAEQPAVKVSVAKNIIVARSEYSCERVLWVEVEGTRLMSEPLPVPPSQHAAGLEALDILRALLDGSHTVIPLNPTTERADTLNKLLIRANALLEN